MFISKRNDYDLYEKVYGFHEMNLPNTYSSNILNTHTHTHTVFCMISIKGYTFNDLCIKGITLTPK
jgi:hypothetical protein